MSSVLMQRYSPKTVMRATQTICANHQETAVGTAPVKQEQQTRCSMCAVAAKSRHCFVLFTTYHSPMAQVRAFKTRAVTKRRPRVVPKAKDWKERERIFKR